MLIEYLDSEPCRRGTKLNGDILTYLLTMVIGNIKRDHLEKAKITRFEVDKYDDPVRGLATSWYYRMFVDKDEPPDDGGYGVPSHIADAIKKEVNMSANVSWYPDKQMKVLPLNCPSKFIEKIEKVFHQFPKYFSEEDIGQLHTMEALEDADKKAYTELIKAIQTHGRIIVKVNYC